MKTRQRGATFLGIVIILLILGIGALRRHPARADVPRVHEGGRALEQVRDEHAAIETNPQLIRNAARAPLGRRGHQPASTGRRSRSTRSPKASTSSANYEAEQPFVANVYLLVKFDKTGHRSSSEAGLAAPPATGPRARLGYRFGDPALLDAALTHRSAGRANYERLEFLGDSVLNFVVAVLAFSAFPDADEGDLSRYRAALVSGETLADVGGEPRVSASSCGSAAAN